MRRLVCATVVASAWLVAGCSPAPPKALTDDLDDLKKRVKALEDTVAEHDTRLKRAKRNPSNTTIVLSKSSPGAGACDTAKVLDGRVGNEHERHVRWDIEADCSLFGAKLELRFDANAKGQFPFPSQNAQARGGNRFVQERIKPSADVDYGVFNYRIWLVPAVGTPKELADPELEVEPPPVIVASAAAPTNASPAVAVPSPPAKKQ